MPNGLETNITLVEDKGVRYLVDARPVLYELDFATVQADFAFNTHYKETDNPDNVFQYAKMTKLKLQQNGSVFTTMLLSAELEEGAQLLVDSLSSLDKDDYESIIADIEAILKNYHARGMAHLAPSLRNIYTYRPKGTRRLRAKLFNFTHAVFSQNSPPYSPDTSTQGTTMEQLGKMDMCLFTTSALELVSSDATQQLSLVLGRTRVQAPGLEDATRALVRFSQTDLTRPLPISSELVAYAFKNTVEKLTIVSSSALKTTVKVGETTTVLLTEEEKTPTPTTRSADDLLALVNTTLGALVSCHDADRLAAVFGSITVEITPVKSGEQPMRITSRVVSETLDRPPAAVAKTFEYNTWTALQVLLVSAKLILKFVTQNPTKTTSISECVKLSQRPFLETSLAAGMFDPANALGKEKIVDREKTTAEEKPAAPKPRGKVAKIATVAPVAKEPAPSLPEVPGISGLRVHYQGNPRLIYRGKKGSAEVALSVAGDQAKELMSLHHPNLTALLAIEQTPDVAYEIFALAFGVAFSDIATGLAAGTTKGGLLHYLSLAGTYRVIREISSLFEYLSLQQGCIPEPETKHLLLHPGTDGAVVLKLTMYETRQAKASDVPVLAPKHMGALLETVVVLAELQEATKYIFEKLKEDQLSHAQLQGYVRDTLLFQK